MNKKIKNLIIDSILLALLIVASKLSIYTSFVPFTFQILVVLTISLLLDYKNALLVIIVYVLMGIVGIPVFSTTSAGITVFINPSFGFIIGFIAMSVLIPVVKKKLECKISNKYKVNFISGIIGLLIDYLFGFFYALLLFKVLMILETDMTVFKIFIYFIAIFVPFDIIKCVLATIISKRVEDSTNN